MSGYRQQGFDPNASSGAGAPMRPFNWVQWLGVALIVVGIALSIAMIGAGLDVAWLQSFRHVPSVVPILLGVVLINSRRHPGTDPAPELAPARQRWLIIIVAICAAVLGVATVIEFSGAN